MNMAISEFIQAAGLDTRSSARGRGNFSVYNGSGINPLFSSRVQLNSVASTWCSSLITVKSIL